MPRWGEWHRLPDGTVVHIDYSGPRPKAKPCKVCGRPSTLLCDYPLLDGRSCDACLCRRCAVRIDADRDYCPSHPPEFSNG